MSAIIAKKENFTLDYRHTVLPDVFLQQDGDADLKSMREQLESSDKKKLIKYITNARLTLLLASNTLSDDDVIQALQQMADKGIRIYILVAGEKENHKAMEALAGRCLIRTGVTQKGALLLVDQATLSPSAYLFTSCRMFSANQVQGEVGFTAFLDGWQIEDSYRSFCHLFWEYANKEKIQQGHQPRAASKNPHGSTVLNHSYQIPAKLTDNLEGALSNSVGVSIGAAKSQHQAIHQYVTRQVLIESDAPSSVLELFAKSVTGMALAECQLPNILQGQTESWLLPDQATQDASNWCLRLSPSQADAIGKTLSQAMEDATWQLKNKLCIGEVDRLIKFVDQPNLPQVCEKKRIKELKDIYTESMNSYLDGDIQALAQAQTVWQKGQLAHQIDYSVVRHPPYCPQGASQDGLYGQWLKADKEWRHMVERLKRQLDDNDNKRSGLSGAVSKVLGRFFLGQDHKRKTLDAAIEGLLDWQAQRATPAQRRIMLIQLESLEQDINTRASKTTLEIDKAKKEIVWQGIKLKLEDSHNKITLQLSEKNKSLENFKEGEPQLRNRLNARFTNDWVAALDKLSEKQCEDHSLELTELRPYNYQQAIKWIDSTFKAKHFNKHYPLLKRSIENFKQGNKKIERELNEMTTSYENLAADGLVSAKRLEEHGPEFLYMTKSSVDEFSKILGNKKHKGVAASIFWPPEELPAKEFQLFNHQGKRWLVMTDTDQLKLAQKEGLRLKAILCAEDDRFEIIKEKSHA